MKRLTYALLLFTGITLAQDVSKFELGDPVTKVVQKAIDSIKLMLPDLPEPEPRSGLFTGLCTLVEQKDYAFEKKLWEISGVDEKNDSQLVIVAKVQKLFDKQWGWFKCNHMAFGVQDGNIFKYSVNRYFYEFIDFMVEMYSIDINRPDPSDNKTLLDFVTDEIAHYQRMTNSATVIKKLEELYRHLVDDYGAKHASELKS